MTDLHQWLMLGVVVLALGALVQQAFAGEGPGTGPEISWRPDPPDHSEDLLERFHMDDREPAKPTARKRRGA